VAWSNSVFTHLPPERRQHLMDSNIRCIDDLIRVRVEQRKLEERYPTGKPACQDCYLAAVALGVEPGKGVKHVRHTNA
jgi:hypothetical protein